MSSTRTMRANGQMGVRRLLTPEEAGGLLGVSAERVTSWCRKGILPGLRMGRIWRIDRQELEGWLRKGRGQNAWQGTLGELAAGVSSERAPETVSVRQAAQMLQLSVRTVQEHAPELGAAKVRRRWRIPYESVRRAQREGLPEAQEVHEVTVVSGSQSQTASDAMECIGVDEPVTTPSQTGQAVRTAAGGRQAQLLIKQDVVSPGYSEAQADLMMQLCLVIGDLMHKRLGLDATADTKPWQIWWTTDPVMANQVGGEALKDQPEEPDDGMGVLMALVRVGGGTDVEQSLAVAGYGWRPTERTIVVYGPYEPDVRDWQTLTLLMAYRETADKLQVGEAANMWLELGQQALPRPAAKRERWVS